MSRLMFDKILLSEPKLQVIIREREREREGERGREREVYNHLTQDNIECCNKFHFSIATILYQCKVHTRLMFF